MTIDGDSPLLMLLDFDGTVCIGDGPIWAYTEAALEQLRVSGRVGSDDAERIREGVRAYLDGSPGAVDAIDGYAAVAALVGGHADPDALQQAYRASRRALAAGTVDVHAPAGLATLLDEASPRVERVVVTNAPVDGVRESLARIGLAERIDRIVADAGKPRGWSRILPGLLGDRPAAHALAVGDIWENDLAEPFLAGCATALIDRFGRGIGTPHLTAARFEDLYDDIRAWTADPDGALAGAASPPASDGSALRTPET